MRGGWAQVIVCLCVLNSGFNASAQSAPDYDTLVHQGNAQLQAGTNDLALTTAQSAIKASPDRWEAYTLAGGALMNLKRYEEAADDFSKAIERAPEAKQTGIRNLRKQCLLAEAGASPNPAATPTPTAAPVTTTTQAEIVLWKTIENSHDPTSFEAYLKEYSQGTYATLAYAHLTQLYDESQAQCIGLNQRYRPPVSESIRDQKEFAAYSNAINLKDPDKQTQALRSFLDTYPTTTVRKDVLGVLMASDMRSRSFALAMADADSMLQIDQWNPLAHFAASYSEVVEARNQTDPQKALALKVEAIKHLQRCTSGGN
jgi:tetratricopeptide (TPR) repeat protein